MKTSKNKGSDKIVFVDRITSKIMEKITERMFDAVKTNQIKEVKIDTNKSLSDYLRSKNSSPLIR